MAEAGEGVGGKMDVILQSNGAFIVPRSSTKRLRLEK